MSKVMIYSKTSEVSKAQQKNDAAAKFQDRITFIQESIEKKQVAINKAVERHSARMKRVEARIKSLRELGIISHADYTECYADFKANILPINAKLLSGLIDDKLQRDLDKCTKPEQEQDVVRFHKMGADFTLKKINFMKEHYTLVGLHKEEKITTDKATVKKSGTRSRKTVKKENA